ncbi:hypothetical protein EV2_002946 [Malus domestica]
MNAPVAGDGCCCCDILKDEMGMGLLTDPNPTEIEFGDMTCTVGEVDTLVVVAVAVAAVPCRESEGNQSANNDSSFPVGTLGHRSN